MENRSGGKEWRALQRTTMTARRRLVWMTSTRSRQSLDEQKLYCWWTSVARLQWAERWTVSVASVEVELLTPAGPASDCPLRLLALLCLSSLSVCCCCAWLILSSVSSSLPRQSSGLASSCRYKHAVLVHGWPRMKNVQYLVVPYVHRIVLPITVLRCRAAMQAAALDGFL